MRGRLPKAQLLRLAVAFVVTCVCKDKEKKYDSGDVVGTTPPWEIRAPVIDGDWSSEAYSEGYAPGVATGIGACTDNSKNSS